MKPPGAPRQLLGEVSSNQRSRVISAYDHGIKVPVIVRRERLTDSTCKSITQNAPHQVSCISYAQRCTLSPYSRRPPPYTTYYSSKSQDYCPIAFRPVRASLQEDNLPVPSKIRHSEVEGQAEAISHCRACATTDGMGYKVPWATIRLLAEIAVVR
jgi:hypothetical protein